MMSENNESIIYSEPVNKILENSDIFFFKWGLLIFLFFIFVLLGLAATVKYPDKIILPQGTVSSVPQTQSIIYSTVIGKPQVDKIKIGARAFLNIKVLWRVSCHGSQKSLLKMEITPFKYS
jgi:hypothetical protein